MNQTTLALIRHGETNWNAERRLQGSSDIPLNETGRAQVRATAALLQGERWDAIVCSPLGRARESAAILADELGLEVTEVVPDITERDYGPAEGLQDGDELRALRIPGGFVGAETEQSVVERATASLADLVARYPGRRVIVVAHGTLIRLALGELNGHPVETISNAGHSVLLHDAEAAEASCWRLSIVNGAAYETPVAPSPASA